MTLMSTELETLQAKLTGKLNSTARIKNVVALRLSEWREWKVSIY